MSTLIFIICGIFFVLGTITISYYLYRIRSRNTGEALNEVLLSTYTDQTTPAAQRVQAGMDLAELLLNNAPPEAIAHAQKLLEEMLMIPALEPEASTAIKYMLMGILLENPEGQSHERIAAILHDESLNPATPEQIMIHALAKNRENRDSQITAQERQKLLAIIDQIVHNHTAQPYICAWAISARTQLLALSNHD